LTPAITDTMVLLRIDVTAIHTLHTFVWWVSLRWKFFFLRQRAWTLGLGPSYTSEDRGSLNCFFSLWVSHCVQIRVVGFTTHFN